MSCDTVIGSIVALLDGELTDAERVSVEAHVAICPACGAELQQVRATRRILTAHLTTVRDRVSGPGFAAVWERIVADPGCGAPAVMSEQRPGGVRPGGAARSTSARRRWLWAGTSAGFAIAAGLAALLVTPRLSAISPGTRGAAPATGPTVVAQPAAPAVAAIPAKAPTRLARNRKRNDAPPNEQVARRSADAPSPADAAPETGPVEEAVAVNELDPPRELLERPDLFLKYPIVRKLDELRNLDAVLAGQGPDEQPGDGGAG